MVANMKYFLSVVLCLLSFLSLAADVSTVKVNPNDRSFVVRLPSNATTGYRWTLSAYDKTLVRLVRSQYIVPETKLIGAGSETVFIFQLLKGQTYPKSTSLSFIYARPWEAKGGTIKNVNVQFLK